VHGKGVQRLEKVENSIENGELTTREDVQLAVRHDIVVVDDMTGGSDYKRYIASEGVGQLFSAFLQGGAQ
jgi:putative selenate reductase FAD-binding subunit